MNRLDFLKYSLLPFICHADMQAGIFNPSISSGNDRLKARSANNKAYYWDKNTRLTIAMWDFSWLTDQGKNGSFENIEQRVEEAAMRGYNTLRIDCFPSRLLQPETTFSLNYSGPESPIAPIWGKVTTAFSCNALQKLKQLADACRKHHIWLGLDSWEKGHMMGHNSTLGLEPERSVIAQKDEEKALRDFGHTWVKAIHLMREEGILERAVWVAPMNEVPHFASRSLESIINIGKRNQNEGDLKLDKNQLVNERFKLINHWLGEEIKDEITKDGIPLSYSSLGMEEYDKRLTDIYDVVDIHCMPNAIYSQEDVKELEAIAKGASGYINLKSYEKIDLKRFSKIWDRACRENYGAMLLRTKQVMTTALNHLTLPSGKRLQGVITEAWGPCYWVDNPDINWEWYKHYNADSARIAASMPFEGVTLSNYGEPLFELWKDEDWHRNANLFILNVLE